MGIMETNFTDDYIITIEDLNAIETKKYIGVLIFCETLLIIGILGNLLVLTIYRVKFKRTRARTYILALAVADLSVCLVGIPYHALDLTMLLVYRYTYLCKTMSFLIAACTNSSIFILLVVGLDRFLKIVRPLKKQIVNYVEDLRACLIAAVVATLVSVPYFILYGSRTVLTDIDGLIGLECFIGDVVEEAFAKAYIGLTLVFFLMTFVYLSVIYAFICVKIHQHDNRTAEMPINERRADVARNGTTNGTMLRLQHKRKHSRKITLMMLTITTIYVLSYLPFIIVSTLTAVNDDFWESKGKFESILTDLALRMYLVNNVTNPIVYSFWDLKFREECLALFRRLCGCNKADGKSGYNNPTVNLPFNRKIELTETSL